MFYSATNPSGNSLIMNTWIKWLSGTSTTGREQRKVLTMPGACHVTIQGGRFRCSCTGGHLIHLSSSNDLSQKCTGCDHRLEEHDDFPDQSHVSISTGEPKSSGSSLPGPGKHITDTGLSNKTSPRTETVSALAHLMESYGIVHIRGTPASGKCTMAKLLSRYYASGQKQRIVFVDDWGDWLKRKKKTVDFLVELCHLQGHKDVRKDNFLNEDNDNLIFILDEGQLTYDDPYFWYSILKERLAMREGPRFCIFSSYGSPTMGSPDYPIYPTPTILREQQRVSLIVPQYDVGHRVCLFFERYEFDDAVKKHVNIADYIIDQNVQDYIFAQTKGHPGITRAMLRFVDQRSGDSQITYSHIRADLQSDDKLFGFLTSDIAGRSFPSRKMLPIIDPQIRDILLRTSAHGSIDFRRDDEALYACFRQGFINVEATKQGHLICVLPSIIHARFIEYAYGQISTQPFVFKRYSTIEQLAMKVLQRFSSNMLCLAKSGQRYGPSGKPRPVEAAFQDEFYRCFHDELGPGAGIVSERSCPGQGRIDFFAVTPGWGFELLRDGSRLAEHCKRFERNGIYHNAIQQGTLSDWLLLDCRHTIPRNPYPQAKLWRVIFSEDYARVRILNNNNEEICKDFALANC